MADIIRLLPDSVANQIAAGEVIQRPASVIKELVENAVDAGATDIRVVIKDAGKTLIQIIDNGCGMSETDVRMAFERHATSKIRSADDLFTLSTMGFRGEALPSICAIAEVEVKTRPKDQIMGTRILISASKVIEQEPCVCETGTVISVRKIFFNVPARRKFLKSDSVELSNIMREFERLALVNNHIRMSIDTGAKIVDLRAASLRIRISELWKNNLKTDHLIPVDVDTSLVKIEGFVTRPEFARRRNPLQFLIVNGRNMRHPYFHKAIVSCFDSLIASDTMPCYFIKFTVDPSTIDVNIHPTKNEIKFEYEQQIWPILVSAVKTALGKFSAVPSIDFEADAIPLMPLREGETPQSPDINYPKDYNPFDSQPQHSGYNFKSRKVESNWESLYDNFAKGANTFAQIPEPISKAEPSFEESLLGGSDSEVAASCIQFATKYIVTSSRNGILVIDQHRAHLKILFEEYMQRVRKADIISQSVMFPEIISLDESQHIALTGILDDLHRLGFAVEYEEGSSWRITSIPAVLKNADPADIILRIIDSVQSDGVNYGKDAAANISINERIALVMARSSAIRRGQKLTQQEMESLISKLFMLPDPSLTPTGNPVYTTLTESSISTLLS